MMFEFTHNFREYVHCIDLEAHRYVKVGWKQGRDLIDYLGT